jgi:indolepyruvate ferredoxin oxidoreductase beta subunit
MVGYLKADSTVIVNDYPIPPVAVTTGQVEYPAREQIDGILKAASGRYYSINVTEKATRLGNVKVVNIMLLGALSALLELPVEVWEQTIEKYVPSKLIEVNRRAFQTGRALIPES